MKKALSLISILIFILFIVGVGIFLFWYWLSLEDSPIKQAEKLHPLDNIHPYMIVKTDMMLGQEPFLYAIIEPGESTEAAALAWRRIGESKISLEEYLNKKVYIDGVYYEGQPLFLKQLPQHRIYGGIISDQPVIKINGITIID